MPLFSSKFTLHTISDVLKPFWDAVGDSSVITFSGDMGAGKTTFISHLCRYLNVSDVVSSPTFALINEYGYNHNGTPMPILHMDWYRLRSTDEAIHAGMEDALDRALHGEAKCFVEWPEQAPDILPASYASVYIQVLSPEERLITVEAK